MSADNGILVRKTVNGKYASQIYFLSNDEYPDPKRAHITDTLEEAIEFWDDEWTEYGFNFELHAIVTVE